MTVAPQDKFRNVIEELASEDIELSQEEGLINSYTGIFYDIYGDLSFQTQYSVITHCIYGEMTPQDAKEFSAITRRADRLVNNLGVLQDYIADRSDQAGDEIALHVQSKFTKLYDHVNLEHVRLLLFEAPYHSKDAMDAEIQRMRKNIDEIKQTSNDVSEKIQASQKDYIAILAIFAAVILAFSGGFGYLSESFLNVADTKLENLICIAALVGLVLVDLLYILLRFVWSIIRYRRDQKSIPRIRVALVVFNILFSFIFALSFYWANVGVPFSPEHEDPQDDVALEQTAPEGNGLEI